jgi:hypothetical protein
MTYPEGFGQPPSGPSDALRVQAAARPLYESKNWLKLLGVVSIGGGVLYALTIVGIILAWLPIWIGILLWQSAKAIEDAHETGDAARFVESQAKLRTFFTIYGVATLIGLILSIVVLIVGVGLLFTAVQQVS